MNKLKIKCLGIKCYYDGENISPRNKYMNPVFNLFIRIFKLYSDLKFEFTGKDTDLVIEEEEDQDE